MRAFVPSWGSRVSLRIRSHGRSEPNIRGTMGKGKMFITAHFAYRSPVTLFSQILTQDNLFFRESFTVLFLVNKLTLMELMIFLSLIIKQLLKILNPET
jgi:hypothetical protein